MYFAKEQNKALGLGLLDRINSYVDYANSSGLVFEWLESWKQYHAHSDGFERGIKTKGFDGELATIVVNHMRNIIQQILVMTTSNRPALLPRAINSDAKSEAQARLAHNILQYYLREKGLEKKLLDTAEHALVRGEGFISVVWNKDLGRELDAHIVHDEQGQVIPAGEVGGSRFIHEGDLEAWVPTIFDIFRDPSKTAWDDNDWLIVRRFVNKYNLAVLHPNQESEIMAQKATGEKSNQKFIDVSDKSFRNVYKMSDDVEIFYFYHKKCAVLPKGRECVMLADGTVLEDTDMELQSEEIPVYRICPSEFLGTQVGYAPTFDLQGLQEAYDMAYSMMLTNINAHGIQNISVPMGSNLEASEVIGGANVWQVPAGSEVKGVNLLSLPAQMFDFTKLTEKAMESISGVNSVARGNIEASQRSGAALALVQSMAVQYNSGFQNSYARTIENVGTAIVRLMRKNAKSKRVISIVGESNYAYLREFTDQDLSNIDRVLVDVGNPLFNTADGKLQMADKLLERGQIKTPEEYFTVIKTGNLERLTETETSSINNIHKENHELLLGRMVAVLEEDDHRLHILKHKTLLDDPDVRRDPDKIKIIREHLMEHKAMWELMSMTAPDVLLALGYQPLMVPQAPPGAMPAGGEGPQIGAPQQLQPEDAARMPTNPMTGEQAEIPPGLGEPQ